MAAYREIDPYNHVVGDLLRAIGAQIIDEDGVVDLTGYSVQFRLVRNSDGTDKVAWTAATISDAVNGKVQYNWLAGDVDEAGTFWAYFRYGDGTNWDTYPKDPKDSNQARRWRVNMNTAN